METNQSSPTTVESIEQTVAQTNAQLASLSTTGVEALTTSQLPALSL